MLDYPGDAAEFGRQIRDADRRAPVWRRCTTASGATTFDASLASLAVRGTLALFGASSGPVPPVDPQRLNAAGSVFLTRPVAGPLHPHRRGIRWRAGELFDAIAGGAISIEVGGRYPLSEAARAHEDLQGRKTTGSLVLLP